MDLITYALCKKNSGGNITQLEKDVDKLKTDKTEYRAYILNQGLITQEDAKDILDVYQDYQNAIIDFTDLTTQKSIAVGYLQGDYLVVLDLNGKITRYSKTETERITYNVAEVDDFLVDKIERRNYVLETDEVQQKDANDIINRYVEFEGAIIDFLMNKENPNKTAAYGFVANDKDGNQYLITIDYKGRTKQWYKNGFSNAYYTKEEIGQRYYDIPQIDKKNSDNIESIKNIQKNLFNLKKVNGDFINIKDSALAEVQQVNYSVNKAQETTEGYQLLPQPYIDFTQDFERNGLKFHINDDFSFTINGTSTAQFDVALAQNIPLEDKDYFIRSFQDNSGSTGHFLFINIDTAGLYGDYNGKGTSFRGKPNVPNYVRFKVRAGQKLDNVVYKPLITLAENKEKPYEPYTGGKPSPNPGYPQEIKKIGNFTGTSCNKNILAVPEKFEVTGVIHKKYKLKKGDYTISYINEVSTGSVNSYLVTFIYNDDTERFVYIPKNEKKYTFTLDKEIKEIIFYSQNNWGNSQGVTTTFKGLMIERGLKATLYEPHQKISHLIDLKGNELLPGEENKKDYVEIKYNQESGTCKALLHKNSGNKKYLNNEISILNDYSSITYAVIQKDIQDINYNKIENVKVICNKATYTYGGSFDDKYKIGKIIGYAWAGNYWIGFPKGTTLEEIKRQLDGLEICYELADKYKQIIDLGEIDPMFMTYLNETNIFTDQDILTIDIEYFQNLLNTIQNLEIDKDTLQKQLQDLEKRLNALETTKILVK